MTEKEILKRDISELETMLGIINSRLNNLYEQGISSIKSGLGFALPLVVGFAIFIKILSSFLLESPDAILYDSFLPISASTVLTTYLTVPFATILGSFIFISNKSHNEYLAEKSGLEATRNYLEEELQNKKSHLEELSQTIAKPEITTEDDYLERLKRRRDIIYKLGTFRKKLLFHNKLGTLNLYLKSLGLTEQEIEESREEVKKRFLIEKKSEASKE